MLNRGRTLSVIAAGIVLRHMCVLIHAEAGYITLGVCAGVKWLSLHVIHYTLRCSSTDILTIHLLVMAAIKYLAHSTNRYIHDGVCTLIPQLPPVKVLIRLDLA